MNKCNVFTKMLLAIRALLFTKSLEKNTKNNDVADY